MIHRKTAQQIADTVKEVCGYDINFINDRGLVIASTDPARIGTVHEGGRQVIARGETLEVDQDGLLPGTKKGVNIPVFRSGVLAPSPTWRSGSPSSSSGSRRSAPEPALLPKRKTISWTFFWRRTGR